MKRPRCSCGWRAYRASTVSSQRRPDLSLTELYLTPDVSQRLVLSLRCGIPQEMDWALERLVQTSAVEPAFLNAHYLPSLAYDLIEVMAEAIDMWESRVRDRQVLRRGIEAAIALRNICLDSSDHRAAAARTPKLISVLARALATQVRDAEAVSAGTISTDTMPAADHAEEFKLCILELIDALVSIPPAAIYLEPPEEGTPSLRTDPKRAIYPLLVRHLVGETQLNVCTVTCQPKCRKTISIRITVLSHVVDQFVNDISSTKYLLFL